MATQLVVNEDNVKEINMKIAEESVLQNKELKKGIKTLAYFHGMNPNTKEVIQRITVSEVPKVPEVFKDKPEEFIEKATKGLKKLMKRQLERHGLEKMERFNDTSYTARLLEEFENVKPSLYTFCNSCNTYHRSMDKCR